MPINETYNENTVVEAIATALDNFYTNLIKKVDSLNVKAVMKRKMRYNVKVVEQKCSLPNTLYMAAAHLR